MDCGWQVTLEDEDSLPGCGSCRKAQETVYMTAYVAYIETVNVNEDWVTIKDTRYSLTGLPPGGKGRFHEAGKLAYYVASGLDTARKVLGVNYFCASTTTRFVHRVGSRFRSPGGCQGGRKSPLSEGLGAPARA
jgi:hypothetical protein